MIKVIMPISSKLNAPLHCKQCWPLEPCEFGLATCTSCLRVVIDPGHGPGNANRGPSGYFEHKGMWALSNYLKDVLTAGGCEVKLTRNENEDPSLTARGNMADAADLFISEHSNAANQAARGVECYYSVQAPGDKVLAASLSKTVSGLMKNPDRGAKTRPSTGSANIDYYSVMASARRANCPHVLLIENGFHDNPLDEAFLLSAENLKAIAEAQAEVILGFFRAKTPINGPSKASVGQMESYIRSKNPAVNQSVVRMLPLYLSEGEKLNIRGDAAFAQSCLETGNFTFCDSAITLEQNNFCGMGVTQNGQKGASFKTAAEGIRAQIQHLKAYADAEGVDKNIITDPRFDLVKRGSAPYIEWLGQKENPEGAGWAAGRGYGGKILKILEGILNMESNIMDKPSDWAKEAWDWAVSNGITDGSNPQGTPTREQVAQMIYNYQKSTFTRA